MNRFERTLLITLALSAGPAAAEPAILAVFELQSSVKLSRRDASALDDYLSTRLARRGRYSVVPRSDVQHALREKKAESYQACYAESCQIEIGKELAAQKTLAPKLSRLGKTCLLTLQIYDLALGATEAAGSASGGCRVIDVIKLIEGALTDLEGPARSALAASPSWKMPRAPRDLDALDLMVLRDLVARGPAIPAPDSVAEARKIEMSFLYMETNSPERPVALLRLARAWGNYGRAIIDAQGPDAPNVQVANVEQLKVLEIFVKQFPERPEMDEALFELGMVYVRRLDAKAAPTFARLVKEHPTSRRRAPAILVLARLYLIENNAVGAEDALTQLARDETSPASAYARFCLAWIFANRKDVKAVRESVDAARALAEKLPESTPWRSALLSEIEYTLAS